MSTALLFLNLSYFSNKNLTWIESKLEYKFMWSFIVNINEIIISIAIYSTYRHDSCDSIANAL